jgi:glyoxylate/hydroxypyruvate reductase A
LNILFISSVDKADLWKQCMIAELPGINFYIWPDTAPSKQDIDYIVAWKPPAGEIAKYPNIKAILSLGAGIDGITCDPDLPRDVPISRLVDRCLTQGMTEYVIYWVLHHHRRMGDYAEMMASGGWEEYLQSDTETTTVGVLGLGELGGDAARALSALHFDVLGWSRSEKSIDGVTCLHGLDGFDEIVSRSSMLICLLPLTEQTAGILNSDTFAKMPKNSIIINCARGAHVVDEDLISALDSGHLAGAVLDVFHQEPLPKNHSYWTHPKVTMTPHMASLTVPQSAARYMADNIRRVERGEDPLNLIDLSKGY